MKPPFRIRHFGLIFLALVAIYNGTSCSKGPVVPPTPDKLYPETELTYAPVQYDTTTFRVHFYWSGYDDDGEVMRFHYAVDDDTLRPSNEWRTTVSKDTILLFLVDPVRELKVHVFKVAAEDNDGRIDRSPASRAFSAKTLPPNSRIEKGPAAFNPVVGPNFTYEWSGLDPDGGETGGRVPVDSFQYLLLRVDGTADLATPPTHPPLPHFSPNVYVDMIRAAVSDSLPAPNGDWKWQGIRALKTRFRNVTPGEYVFAERAVDIAGATEKDLVFVRNIRHFTVTSRNAGPVLNVCSSILNRCLDPAIGPDDYARKQLQIFEGETVSFSWTANAESYGGEIVGFTYAMDDTSSFPGIDIRSTGATYQPSQLPPGNHFLYVRVVDDGGLTTNITVPLLIVHPSFKDPGAPRKILFVDDSDPTLGNGSRPTDDLESRWWTERNDTGQGPLITIFDLYGIPYTEWDTIAEAAGGIDRRKQPEARNLAEYTTVVWTTDAENGGSLATGLFRSVAGGDYSELQGYLRAGGTLILTGWSVAQATTGLPGNQTYDGVPGGICTTYPPGTPQFNQTIFPRMYMGIDRSVQSREGRRAAGAFDFVRGIPTATAIGLGFDTARVDTGNTGTGVQYPATPGPGQVSFKWNTNHYPFVADLNSRDQRTFPGLAGIEGWVMAQNFGCRPIQNFNFENPADPIIQVLYTYHGVRVGADQDGGPSPREGLACGLLGQSHDLGASPNQGYVPSAALGRYAIFTFPLYFLKDADAVNIMRRSFEYVNASPTLP